MEITLRLSDGQTKTFSEQELVKIVEEKFSKESVTQVVTEKVAQAPIEGEKFEVNPMAIDKSLFQEKRNNTRQEWTRQIILEAFEEVDKHPKKYASSFYTYIPKSKRMDYQSILALKAYANDLGGLVATWVEQALEWAQRISNGERWESICNKADNMYWYRMIIWKNGQCKLVGGSRYDGTDNPPSYVFYENKLAQFYLYYSVPLVVFKEN